MYTYTHIERQGGEGGVVSPAAANGKREGPMSRGVSD